MCGICGIALSDPRGKVDNAVIKAMCKTLSSRGPDQMGIALKPGAGLGHQRLQVIDLATGQQPMSDITGRFCIVFNGEIYNYTELKHELAQKGCFFRTQSDTEVLLQGLINNGIDFLHKVNGMFAFALWDAEKRELLLARDRFGVKPLCYMQQPEGLYFASEASALETTGKCSNIIDRDLLGVYLALSYLPGQRGLIQGIQRLDGGGWLKYRCGEVASGIWWNTAERWQACHHTSAYHTDSDWTEEFSAMLKDAVSIRLKSDVPLGAFLSSGIDSACIVALMKKDVTDIRTFTMAFTDKSHNEAQAARATADFLGTRHEDFLSDAIDFSTLQTIATGLDEPFADTSLLPTYLLCRHSKQRVTVALSGDGADELLAGYPTHTANSIYKKILRLPPSIVHLFQALVRALPDNRKKVSTVFKLKQFFNAYPRSPELAHASWRMLLSGAMLDDLLPASQSIAEIFLQYQNIWKTTEGLPELDRFLCLDYATWLAGDILVKADRASMRHGLEVRSPFLDYRLFELCAKMPSHLKHNGFKGKIILRRVAANLFPTKITNRPKRGFNAPVADWLHHKWHKEIDDLFASISDSDDGISKAATLKLWAEHKNNKSNHGFTLLNIAIYLLWKSKHTTFKVGHHTCAH